MPKLKALTHKIKLLVKIARRRRRGRKRRRRNSLLRRFIVPRLSLLSYRWRKQRYRLQCQHNQSLIALEIKQNLSRINPILPLHLLLTQCSNNNSNSSLPMAQLNQSFSSPSCPSSTQLSYRTLSPSRSLPPISFRFLHRQVYLLHLATSSIPHWMF